MKKLLPYLKSAPLKNSKTGIHLGNSPDLPIKKEFAQIKHIFRIRKKHLKAQKFPAGISYVFRKKKKNFITKIFSYNYRKNREYLIFA